MFVGAGILWVWRMRSVNKCECQRHHQLKAEELRMSVPFLRRKIFIPKRRQLQVLVDIARAIEARATIR